MEIKFICPNCEHSEVKEYYVGIFDDVFYSEPRLPIYNNYLCPICKNQHRLTSPMWVQFVEGDRISVASVVADEFDIFFSFTNGQRMFLLELEDRIKNNEFWSVVL